MNKEDYYQKVALYRYSLIASAVVNTFEAPSLAQHLRNIASKEHLHPNGKHKRVSFYMLERWLYAYKKFGLQALTPKTRGDCGKSRKLSNAAVQKMHEIKEKYPYITAKAIYKKLIEEDLLNVADISLSSIQRFIRNNGLKSPAVNQQTVKAFEMEFANDCWQADTAWGPVIKINGKKTQTFLISFIDDASRMITHGPFYTRMRKHLPPTSPISH
jgi:transposase